MRMFTTSTVQVLLLKEWLELRKDRGLLLSTLLPPFLFTVIPVAAMIVVGNLPPDNDTAQLGIAHVDPTLAGLSQMELVQAVLGKQFALLFLLMPLMIPTIIAAYSIVGEKSRRTLEPLLATPISVLDLLLAKSLTALIPSVLITWACAAVYVLGLGFSVVSERVFGAIISPAWLVMILICSPLLTLLAIAGSVAISARVNDPRTAQQLSAVTIVPILALFFGQLFGLLVLDLSLVVAAALILGLLAAAMLWLAIRLFDREAILTRWT